MKLYIQFIIATCLIGASLSWAGNGDAQPGGKGDKEARLERMKQHLDLTDDQIEQIREIRAAGGGRDEVRAVLDEQQLEKMQVMRQQRKQAGKGMRHGGKNRDSAASPVPTEEE